MAGGTADKHAAIPSMHVEVYHPEIDTWTTAKSSLLQPAAPLWLLQLDRELICVNDKSVLDEFEESSSESFQKYCPQAETWTRHALSTQLGASHGFMVCRVYDPGMVAMQLQ